MRDFIIEDESIYEAEESEDPREAMKARIKRELIEKLAREWNEIQIEIEHRSWRSQEQIDAEEDYFAEMCESHIESAIADGFKLNQNSFSEEDYENYLHNRYYRTGPRKEISPEAREAIQKREEDLLHKLVKEKELKDQEALLRREAIEELLRENGARMMRPYEHWNEEEKYMEYMENRYNSRDEW